MEQKMKKVVIAAGGTGGHLFPAQALAEELKNASYEIVFAGAALSENRYFDRSKYRYCDVASATPFRRSLKALVHSVLSLAKGLKQGLQLMKQEAPALVVGFGSFHSFSVLLAAYLKKVPYVLFESNAFPGKVNRLFAKRSQFTAIAFPKASDHLRGSVFLVEMPVRTPPSDLTREAALNYFGLKGDLFTLLVFGGSQGAQFLNQKVAEAALQCGCPLQVIHLAGNADAAAAARQCYEEKGITACVKEFESRMDLAYTAASLAVARAGAATVSELIAFTLPSILIPYPYAADDHQTKNASFWAEQVQGGVYFHERDLSVEQLSAGLKEMIGSIDRPKQALFEYQFRHKREKLCPLICNTLQNL